MMRKSKGRNSKLLPNSLRIISSCIKTVSTNASTAVRSAGASVAASISAADDRKEQVLWAGFDKLEISTTSFRRVLLLGYFKGFQVFDVEDATGLSELISKRDGPVTFLQMLPTPANSAGAGKYKSSWPLLVVVGGNEDERNSMLHNNGVRPSRYGPTESSLGSPFDPPTSVRFYSMKLNEYVKDIDFKSAVLMVRCSPRVVAVGLEEQIHCFDALTLEKIFVVVTYPVPRVGDQGTFAINTGYGPMAVGPRWLAYTPNRPFMVNTGRVSPKSFSSSVSPSTSPGGSSMMARYAMESSKQLANGLLTLGDKGYKKLSKYCPELLPEGPSSPGWNAGKKAMSADPENAGLVAVKDIVCSEVIAQFRAHTSPISALCFDPSGTLLVTASVHGNNINIFRIMPCHTCSNGSSPSTDWSKTYVHLYKLHRGITSAVIQDICISQYSQWIAIVSSRGTCHIFTLSPFGGDNSFQTLVAHGHGTALFLASSPPWWSTSSFAINEPHSLPPPPCTLNVVARIRSNDSGLVNSVSNVAASMVGKLWVPLGALAAVFHNSSTSGTRGGNSLEHILVYAPSGFVVQHEILLPTGLESNEYRTQSLSTQQVNQQNEELRVKADPVQWWDVCRRLDNVEREESISGTIFDGHGDKNFEADEDFKSVSLQEKTSSRGKKLDKNDSMKSLDRSHWYLSNAEVQINSCRFPLWKKSNVCFHVMEAPTVKHNLGGEFEIEVASSHEIEIKHKDLLPIFDHFPSARSGWHERYVHSEVRYSAASSNGSQAREKTNEASFICHSNPPSFSSTESSEGGLSRRMENLLDLDHTNIDKSPLCTNKDTNFIVNNNVGMSRSCSSAEEIPPVNDENNTDSATDFLTTCGAENPVDFAQLFKDGYCNNPELCHGPNQSSNDHETDTNCSNHDDENPKEEEGWIGGMFDLEEG